MPTTPGRLFHLPDADNHVRGAANSVSQDGTGQAAHGIELIRILPLARVWRSAANDTDTRLSVDFGSARAVDLCALVNHNLSASAELTLRGGDDAETTTNAVRRRWTAAGHGHRRNTWFRLDSPVTRRYWQLRLNDAANADGFLQAGYLMLGRASEAPIQMQSGWTRSPRKIIRRTESELRSGIVGRTVSSGHRIVLEFLTDDAGTIAIEDWLDALDADPLFLVPQPEMLTERDGMRVSVQAPGYFVRIEDAEEPWQTTVAVDNGPNRVSVAFQTDDEGSDISLT